MFDPDCFTLAEHFLDDDASAEDKNLLAQHIQDAVEDWFMIAEGTSTQG